MRIYRWKKPTVIISKGNDGSLSPGTYYVWGYWGFGPTGGGGGYWYSFCTSPRPDVQTVVLSSGETSITVSLLITGDITSISDYGSGKVKITSPLHCLTKGDTITITGTTNYDGTYTIADWIDYNNFTIIHGYNGNQTGTWSCSTRNNSATHLIVYIHTTYPFDAKGQYVIPAGQNRVFLTTNNSVKITSYPSYTYNAYCNYAADCNKLTLDAKYLIEYGYPYITGTETDISDTQFNSEFEAAGVSNICEIGTAALNLNNFWYIGIGMIFPNLVKTVTYGVIKLSACIKIPNVKFKNCSIEKIGYTTNTTHNYSIQLPWAFQIENCNMELMRNTAGGYNDIVCMGRNRLVNAKFYSNIEAISNVTNSNWGQVENIGISRTIENLSIVSGVITLYGTGNSVPAFKNLTFYDPSQPYDIYIDTNGSSISGIYVNVNTNRINNRVICKNVYSFRSLYNFYFYRQKDIYVYDKSGSPINEALITITQGSNNYTCMTDINGKATTPLMLEQKNEGISGSYDYNNTIYYDWNLKIEKSGYEIYLGKCNIAKDIEEFVVLENEVLKISSLTFTHPTTHANGTISFVAAGGVAPYQYSIDGGTSWHSSGDFTGLLAGSYDIMVKDNEGTIVEGGTIILKSSDFINVDDMTIEIGNEQVLVEVEQEDEVIVVIE
ncbi:MAG: SprB repeat-containing protein [Ignavibacteria bacterium]